MFLPYKTAEEWEFLASVDFLRKGLKPIPAQVRPTMAALRETRKRQDL